MSREGAGGFAGAGDGSRARSPTHPGIRSVAGAQITTVMGVNEPIGTGCVLKALLLPSPFPLGQDSSGAASPGQRAVL